MKNKLRKMVSVMLGAAFAFGGGIPLYAEDARTSSQSGWQSCGTMTSGRSYMSSAAFGEDIFTFGGTENGIVTDKAEYYDTSAQEWSERAVMPYGRYKHTAVLCRDKIYIGGGYDAEDRAVSEISVYDIDDDEWLPPIQTPDNSTCYAFGEYDNELYIFSGKENETDTNKVYKYDPETNNWSSLSDMPVYAADGKAVATTAGFYIISDFCIYEYDVREATWKYIDKMAYEVYDHAAVNRGNGSTDELYITGGREEEDGGAAVSDTEYRYNRDALSTVTNWEEEWYNDLSMPVGLACHNMVIADNNIYVFGGQTEFGEDSDLIFKRSLDDTKDDNTERTAWNGIIYGSVNYFDDTDHYSFEPETDGYYEIVSLDPVRSNNSRQDFNITVSGLNGDLIVEGMYTNSFGAVYMQAGTVYDIDIFDIEEKRRGNYTYRIDKIDDDAGDTIEQALTIPVEQDAVLSFAGKDDIDYVKFEIPDTGRYNIKLTGQEPNIGEQYTYEYVKIYDESKKEIYDFDTYFDDVFGVRLEAGVYYMSLTPMEFYYDKRTSEYTLSINAAPDGTGSAAVGSVTIDGVKYSETLPGTGTVTAVTVTRDESDDLTDCIVYAALYSGERLAAVRTARITDFEGSEKEIELTPVSASEGDELKVFVWNEDMTPAAAMLSVQR